MRFFFTAEDKLTVVRGSEIRMALRVARHSVIHGQLGSSPPEGTDVWMYGLGVDGLPPLDDVTARRLCDYSGTLVLFQLCDAPTMSFERISPDVAARVRLFLRNHWPKDDRQIPEEFRSRLGFLPPMLKFMRAKPGEPLRKRTHGSVFFGSRTGFSNLGSDRNAREETVRIMRASGLPFTGGLLKHRELRYHTDPTLIVPKIRDRDHSRLLLDSRICLAPWGNHPLTYRLFEGLASRCLVVAQALGNTRFLDAGLEPGRHYVEVSPDLSNLAGTVDYYLHHLGEAQAIADAGYEHFARHFQSRGRVISSWLFESSVSSWGDLYQPSDDWSMPAVVGACLARIFPEHQ